LIHWFTAFVCAVEPCALSLPLAHAGASPDDADDADDAAVDVPVFELLVPAAVLELEHAASATALARSPAMTPTLYSFTRIPLRQSVTSVERDARRAK
jgi:hypothetical protein